MAEVANDKKRLRITRAWYGIINDIKKKKLKP